jgi:hypothetical protein
MGQEDEVQHFSFLFNSPISGNFRKTSTILLSRSGTLKKEQEKKGNLLTRAVHFVGCSFKGSLWTLGISGSPTKEFSSMEVGATIVHIQPVSERKTNGKAPHHPSKYINEKKYKAAR